MPGYLVTKRNSGLYLMDNPSMIWHQYLFQMIDTMYIMNWQDTSRLFSISNSISKSYLNHFTMILKFASSQEKYHENIQWT